MKTISRFILLAILMIAISAGNLYAQVEVIGPGNTSATKTFVVKNSDSDTSFVILDNGNVGIGTSSPEVPLKINGDFYGSQWSRVLLLLEDSGQPIFRMDDIGDATSLGFQFRQAGELFIIDRKQDNNTVNSLLTIEFPNRIFSYLPFHLKAGYGNSDNIPLKIQHAENPTADYLQICSFTTSFSAAVGDILTINSAGNIGIGTTSPGAKLDVRGDIITGLDGSGGYLILAAIGSTNEGGEISWHGAGSYDNWQQDINTNNLRFFTNSTTTKQVQMFNDGTAETGLYVEGNVGIGTWSPATKLVVNGGKVTISRDGTYECCGNDATLALGENTDTYGTRASISFHNVNEAEGTLRLIKDSVNWVNTISKRIQLYDNQSNGMGLEFTGGLFYGLSNSRTQTRTDAGLQGNAGAQSGFYETDGVTVTNYPAGASLYWHLIDVRHSNYTNNYALQIAGSFYDQRLWFRKTINDPAQAWTEILTTANGVDGSGTANYLPKWTPDGTTLGNSQLFDDGTYVGIGTNTPGAKLDVRGNIITGLDGSGGRLDLAALNSTTGGRLFWHGAAAYDDWVGDLYLNNLRFFNTSANSNLVEIFNDGTGEAGLYVEGNVGVGTMSPGQKLTVAGTIESTSGGIKFPDETVQTTALTGGVSGTFNFYNDGTSGNVTSIAITGGIITNVTVAP